MKTFTLKNLVPIPLSFISLIFSGNLLAQTPTVTIDPPAGNTITVVTGVPVNFTATRNGNQANWPGGNSNFTYTWNSSGPASVSFTPPSSNCNCNSGSTVAIFSTVGTYTISCTGQEGGGGLSATSATKTVIVVAPPAGPNLWGCTNSGNAVSSFAVANGALASGPTTLFDPFPTSTQTTSALGRNDIPSPANGFYYFLPNTTGNSGVVTVFASTAAGGSITNIGTLDINGASTTSLGFVRLGMGPDGTGWILAGDGTTLYLAKFMSDGINPVTITLEDANGVTLNNGAATTFQNGDLCVSGTGTFFALANDGNGVTQIFLGSPNGNNTALSKKWDLVDAANIPFTGSVNGVAFDALGSLYISTSTGLFYINQNTVNGPAGTVQCVLVAAITGLTDLASNVFPTQTTLPIKLVYFKAYLNNGSVKLSWESAVEDDVESYTIQRSVNGGAYTNVGVVNAVGRNHQYTYNDPIQGNPDKILYRLLISERASYSYSDIVLIRTGLKGDVITVTPNPFKGKIQLNVSSEGESTLKYSLIAIDGKQVNTGIFKVSKGSNSFFINDLEALQPGIYLLNVMVNDKMSTVKLVKE